MCPRKDPNVRSFPAVIRTFPVVNKSFPVVSRTFPAVAETFPRVNIDININTELVLGGTQRNSWRTKLTNQWGHQVCTGNHQKFRPFKHTTSSSRPANTWNVRSYTQVPPLVQAIQSTTM